MFRYSILTGCAAVIASAAIGQANAPKPVPRADFIKSIDSRFNAIDTNHDGFISKQEIIAEEQRAIVQINQARDQKMQAEFKKLDTNHDGQLSMQEFMAAAPQVRVKETPDQALSGFDTNHDGKISADEFRAPQMAKFNKADLNHDGTVTPDEMRKAQGQK